MEGLGQGHLSEARLEPKPVGTSLEPGQVWGGLAGAQLPPLCGLL